MVSAPTLRIRRISVFYGCERSFAPRELKASKVESFRCCDFLRRFFSAAETKGEDGYAERDPFRSCYTKSMKTTIRRTRLPNVTAVEASPTGRHLYVRLDDGRAGCVDMSEWTGPPCDRWDTEGFDNWRVEAGGPCWGEDAHISADLCAEELVEIPYQQWLESSRSVPVSA